MSVEPGFYGQKFISFSLEKIKKLKEFILRKNLKTLIEVDGGVTENNLVKIIDAGADIIVAGSAVFRGNIQSNIKKLKMIT